MDLNLASLEKAKLTIYNATNVENAPAGGAKIKLLNAALPVKMPKSPINLVPNKTLTVQYNPSTLTLQGNAQQVSYTSLQKNMDEGVVAQCMRPPNVTLSVELVLDAVHNKDAFMADKFRISAADAAEAALAILALKRGGFTVQPETNALLTACMQARSKFVNFRWADMSFTGMLTEVQAQYTMFSLSGKPIRSIVRLNISQDLNSKAQRKYWKSALYREFLPKGKSGLAKAGNLVNGNLF